MLIARDQEIARLPAVRVRRLMREIREYAVTVGVMADNLGMSRDDAHAVIARLEAEGFVCRVDPHERNGGWFLPDEASTMNEEEALDYWGTTLAGNSLSKARVGKPMPRDKAQALLNQLIARAAAVNADPNNLFTVETIEVFGSFADPTRDEVGDVDLHVLFDRRVDGDEFIQRTLAAARAAEKTGRRFKRHVDRLGYLESEFERNLRGRSSRLDIQFDAVGHESPLPDGVVTQVVYSRRVETPGWAKEATVCETKAPRSTTHAMRASLSASS